MASLTDRPFDLLVEGGSVVDGTGGPRYSADVGIVGDTIAEIGDLTGRPASRTIAAAGLIVAPGFIDALHNADMAVLLSPDVDMAIGQGVTTALVGCCGMSMAPLAAATREDVRQHAFFKTGYHEHAWDWSSVAEYLAKVDRASAVNVATLVGFDNLWFAVHGFDASPPTTKELAAMRDLAAQGMADGAIGMSHGAGAASCWSTHEQVAEVARGLFDRQGVYACHQRRIENGDPFAWVREGIAVGTEADIPVHFVHFKSLSSRTHGREKEMLDVVDQSRDAGARVTLGSYPYAAGGGGFRVPPWAEDGGPSETAKRLRDPETRRRIVRDLDEMWTWETYVTAIRSEQNRWMDGRGVSELASEAGTSVGDIICRIVEHDYGAQHVHQHGGDEGLETIMVHENHIACSDAIYVGDRPHPRCYGTYARYLGHHVRERRVMSLEECVRQMTSSPAKMIGLPDRGEIRVGAKADLVLFDDGTIADRATWADPNQEPSGIAYVAVNGTVVRENGAYTGATPGRALRREAT